MRLSTSRPSRRGSEEDKVNRLVHGQPRAPLAVVRADDPVAVCVQTALREARNRDLDDVPYGRGPALPGPFGVGRATFPHGTRGRAGPARGPRASVVFRVRATCLIASSRSW